MKFKRMGVMNVTPNSFSDGGELSLQNIQAKLHQFGPIDALDIGAESTAPMNASITHQEEWERLLPLLPFLENLPCVVSLDTYHPETIFKFAQNCKGALIWNDISGKFDESVREFLKLSENFHYVFCHNLAPTRSQSGQHMQFVSEKDKLEDIAAYFAPHIHPRVIFDPCLGFSKTYEQNWVILDHFHELQNLVPHNRWLLGLSRKSFLRKKFGLTLDSRDELDQRHIEVVHGLLPSLKGEIWIRTHRPEKL